MDRLPRGRVKRKWLILYSVIFIALAVILPRFQLTLPIGSPNFGATAVTLAAALLPWPIGAAAGIIKGISVSFWGGSLFVELPAGVGDALSALLTSWLVKRWRRTYAIIVGQISRFIFTSGMVAVTVGILVATRVISPGLSPFGNLSLNAWQNIVSIWQLLSYPAIAISVAFNLAASLFLSWLFGEIVELTLYHEY
jgi:hypothetical protein